MPAVGEMSTMPGHLLRRCQQIAVSIFLKDCRDFDMTPIQFALLGALAENGEMDQVRLGGLTALDRTTISTVIQRLEERGLVARRQSDKDRRSKVITILPPGRELLAEILPMVRQVQDRILAPLGEADRRELIRLLALIAEESNEESRAPLRLS